MQTWIAISLISMLANAAKVLVVKYLCSNINSRTIVFASRLFSTIILLPLLIIYYNTFPLSKIFWIVVAITSTITASASVMYTEAVKKGPLSTVAPIQAALPVFSILTLALLHHQSPTLKNTFLIVMTAAGTAYTLHLAYRSKNNSIEHKGSFRFALYSLIAAAIFGISTILDRSAIENAAHGALAYTACWNLASAIVLTPSMLKNKLLGDLTAKKTIIPILAFSIITLLAFYTQQSAVQISLAIPTAVVNVKAIVMLHLPILTLFGWLVLREKTTKKTLCAGLATITFGILLVRSLVYLK